MGTGVVLSVKRHVDVKMCKVLVFENPILSGKR